MGMARGVAHRAGPQTRQNGLHELGYFFGAKSRVSGSLWAKCAVISSPPRGTRACEIDQLSEERTCLIPRGRFLRAPIYGCRDAMLHGGVGVCDGYQRAVGLTLFERTSMRDQLALFGMAGTAAEVTPLSL